MICNQVSVFHKIGWEHESMEIFPPPNYLNEHRCFDPDDLGENRDAGGSAIQMCRDSGKSRKSLDMMGCSLA